MCIVFLFLLISTTSCLSYTCNNNTCVPKHTKQEQQIKKTGYVTEEFIYYNSMVMNLAQRFCR